MKTTITDAHAKASDALYLLGVPHGCEVTFNYPSWPYSYRADIWLPHYRVIIEIDGPYHEARRYRDRERDQRFREDLGIYTIRVKNSEIEADPVRVMRRVLARCAGHPTFIVEAPYARKKPGSQYQCWETEDVEGWLIDEGIGYHDRNGMFQYGPEPYSELDDIDIPDDGPFDSAP